MFKSQVFVFDFVCVTNIIITLLFVPGYQKEEIDIVGFDRAELVPRYAPIGCIAHFQDWDARA